MVTWVLKRNAVHFVRTNIYFVNVLVKRLNPYLSARPWFDIHRTVPLELIERSLSQINDYRLDIASGYRIRLIDTKQII